MRRDRARKADLPRPTEAMPAVPPKRLPDAALVLLLPVSSPLRAWSVPTSSVPQRAVARRLVHRRAAGGAGGIAGHPQTARCRSTSGGATSTTRFSSSWSRKPSASIPACARRACASSRRAPSSGSPAAASTLNCSSSTPTGCGSEPRTATARLRASGPARLGLDVVWELDFWGKFRRGIESADAGYFASIAQYDDLQVLVAAQAASFYAANSHHRAAAAHRARERRAAEAQPRDHRAPVPQRQRVRARRAAGPHALPEHAGDDPRTGGQPAPDPERARRPARHGRPARCRRWTAERERIPDADLGIVADVPADLLRRRPDVRAAELQTGRAVGPHRGEQVGALPCHRARPARWSFRRPRWQASADALDYGLGPVLVWNIFD